MALDWRRWKWCQPWEKPEKKFKKIFFDRHGLAYVAEQQQVAVDVVAVPTCL